LLLRKKSRDASGWAFAESAWRDLQLGLRSLCHSPGFMAVALVSLALGIGANVAIFTFINALFLSPLPVVADSGGLVAVHYRTRGGAGYFDSMSYPGFEYVRAANHGFTDLFAYSTWTVTVRTGDGSEAATAELVSPNYFAVLGVRATVGRTFLPTEGLIPGADPVVVVAHDFWQQRLNADRSIVGRSLQVGDGAFTIVGIAPKGFQGLSLQWERPPAFWLLASMSGYAVPDLRDVMNQWGNHSFSVLGRMRRGLNLAQATADLAATTLRMQSDHPESGPVLAEDGVLTPVLVPATRSRFSPALVPDIVDFLKLLGATAALIFLIACFNVAGLVLARATRRRDELALQLSLGATPGRLIRQLLTENALLSFFGSVAGLLVARWCASGLSWFGQAFRTRLAIDSSIDFRVFGFAFAVASACILVLTALPARLASRASLTAVISGGVSSTAGTRRRGRAQQLLVVVQVALSVVLVVGASLFVRTLQNARAVDPTVRPQEVLLGEVNLRAAHYDEARGSRFYSQVLDRLRSLPGVSDAALVFVVPLGGRRGGTDIVIDRQKGTEPGKAVQVGFNVVTPGYFRTVGLPMVGGRDLAESDRANAGPVAVINEVMAQRMFAGRSPIGERFLLQWPPAKIVEVVGVVRDGRFRNYRSPMEPTVYVPLAQRYQPVMTLEVRTAANAGPMLPAIRRELAAIDKTVPLTRTRTVKAHFDAALARERLTASLLSVAGGLALLLAAVGLYGILSYMVAVRTRELGIRMALGAPPSRIVRVVLARLLVLVAIGLAAGTIGARILAPLGRRLLFGVEPTDPFSVVTAAVILIVTAALALWLPARRASRIDPVIALRCN
jgi:predicted permease